VKAQSTRAFRLGLGVVVIGATLLTAGCAQGQHAMTSVESPVIDGATANVGDIGLHVVLVATPPDKFYAVASDAAMKLVLVNNGHSDDSLTKVDAPAFAATTMFESGSVAGAQDIVDEHNAATASQAPTTGPGVIDTIDIKAGDSVPVGQTNDQPAILLRSLTAEGAGDDKGLFPAEAIPVTFTFKNAGSVTVRVPVELSTTPNTLSVPPLSGSAAE
jgi:copper(I)-binding protein